MGERGCSLMFAHVRLCSRICASARVFAHARVCSHMTSAADCVLDALPKRNNSDSSCGTARARLPPVHSAPVGDLRTEPAPGFSRTVPGHQAVRAASLGAPRAEPCVRWCILRWLADVPADQTDICGKAKAQAPAVVSRLSISLSTVVMHRSHFGSRYKLGCCGHAGLLFSSRVRIFPSEPSRSVAIDPDGSRSTHRLPDGSHPKAPAGQHGAESPNRR